MSENDSLPNPFAAPQSQTTESLDLEGLERETDRTTKHLLNFPSFYPVAYHNVTAQIPQNYWPYFKLMYNAAVSFTYACIFQVIVSFFTFTIKSNSPLSEAPFKDVFMSIVLAIFLPALLFSNQYYPYYCSIRDERADFKLSLIQTFILIGFVVLLIGVPGSGAIGIWWVIIAINSNSILAAVLGVILIIWQLCNFALQIMCLVLHRESEFRYNGRITNPADV